jgi:hypothetical protein
MTNYRPMSSLTGFSKVLEEAMQHRLNQHLLQTIERYVCRRGISTEDAAFGLTNSVCKYIKQRMHVGGIFCDLAKAFDCMSHEF